MIRSGSAFVALLGFLLAACNGNSDAARMGQLVWQAMPWRSGTKVTLAQAAAYAGVPFLLGLIANWAGGFLAEAVGRSRLGFAGLLTSALLLLAGIVSQAVSFSTAAAQTRITIGVAAMSPRTIPLLLAGKASALLSSLGDKADPEAVRNLSILTGQRAIREVNAGFNRMAERLAKGEIDPADYKARLDVLKGL